MDRRQFFRRGIAKAAEVVMSAADQRTLQKARRWLRPPFAVDELDFLAKCTRCDACVDACPHQVIFPLQAVEGSNVAGTPALDLLHKGCRLCGGWPCVTACETGALAGLASTKDVDGGDGGREGTEHPRPRELDPDNRLSAVVIDPGTCLPYLGPECGACRDSCPVSALVWQGDKPVIDQDRCVGCALCREACVTEPESVIVTKAMFEADG